MENSIKKSENAQHSEDCQLELNSKILIITRTIADKFSELSKCLEEMPETTPNNSNPEITLHNLKTYYETLDSLLKNYILAHSDGSVDK